MYVPHINASLSITPETPIAAHDRQAPDHDYRVIVLRIGDLNLHLGLNDDAATVAVIDRLIEPLQELRSAALRRMAETEAVPA